MSFVQTEEDEDHMVLNLTQPQPPPAATASIYRGRLDSRQLAKAYESAFQDRTELGSEAVGGCDLRLHCQSGKFVKVHRSLVMALSPFLAKVMLEVDPFYSKDHLDLLLPDMSHAELQNLATFLYLGAVDGISRRNSRTLIKWLKVLGVPCALSETPVGVARGGRGNDDNNPATKIFIIDEADEQQHQKTADLSGAAGAKTADQSADDKLMCKLCNKVFHCASYMKTHLLTHTGEKPHPCPTCGLTFRYKETLNAHLRKHLGTKFCCPICGKEYLYKKDLNDHKKTHLLTNDGGEKVSSLECSMCGAGNFRSKVSLREHQEAEHPTQPAKCPECGKVLKNATCLKAHMKSHHNNAAANQQVQKPTNRCGECGKLFKRKQDLKSHMRVHTGEKPYDCKVCGKAFGLASNFSKHRRTHSEAQNQATGNYYNVGLGNRKKLYPVPPHHHHHQVQLQEQPVHLVVGEHHPP